jgi:hypothetical protein
VLSFKFRVENDEGLHVTVGVFAGTRPGSRGKAGSLTFRREEWDELWEILLEGGKARGTVMEFDRLEPREGGGYENVPA